MATVGVKRLKIVNKLQGRGLCQPLGGEEWGSGYQMSMMAVTVAWGSSCTVDT